MKNPTPVRLTLSRIVSAAILLAFLLMLYCIATGFPPEVLGRTLHLKNLKPLFILFLGLISAGMFLHPLGPAERLRRFKKTVERFAAAPYAIWIIFALGCFLFTWQQITEYFAVEINFLPFSFYDYMLYYYFQGKIHFTGLLHTFYHINNILFLFAPFWKLFPSPLLLVLSYGLIAAAAVFPLYAVAKERFRENLPALFTAFLYLNYRYLQKVLQMNFSPEIFYPLFIFWALAAAMKGRWGFYYLALVLGLSVKEDSFLYFGAVGLLVVFLPQKEKNTRAKTHGWIALLTAGGYYLFITRIFMPWSGSDLLARDLKNFHGHGTSEIGIIQSFLQDPSRLALIFWGDPEKMKTYWNLFSRLAFLPLFSPAVFLVMVPLFPLFLHSTGRDADFISLKFHYSAAVIPFIFIAFVFGFSNLLSRLNVRQKKYTLWGFMVFLLLINGTHYRTEKITPETLKSIAWAKSIPQGTNLVTHGHLLPYIGYRRYNYYFADPFELGQHPDHEPYRNADYYLLDYAVNPYPMDRLYVDKKIQMLKEDPRYELARHDHSRYLFRKK